MDFGSAFGPLHVPIKSRSQLMTLVDDAATNCTVSYRAPELFEGGAMHGEEDIDLSKADVWSLGCLLFAIMFGASPFECELRGEETIRIVDCSYLRILGNVPKPLPGTKMSKWYAPELMDLTTWILNKDRFQRPKLDEVKSRVEELLLKFQGERCWLEKDDSQYLWNRNRNGNSSTTIVENLDISSVSVDADDMEALLRRV
jgi:serine/threonine kinase 16